ncbi:MAG: MBL fold metallo-hydrolase [Candidatus Latescibacteria bacterium]|nr:MBL fold metallo-hydrolase [Candidatus Latescibacterota bacterium]
MSIELTLIGTGTPAPLVHRAGSSYLAAVEGQKLLFDCGPGSVRRLLEKGQRLTEIGHLFLTHLHYDHCVDYGYFTLTRWDQGVGRIEELQVSGPAPLARTSRLLFDEDGVYGPDLAGRTQHPGSHFVYEMRGGVLPRQRPTPHVVEVGHGSCVEGQGWSVTAAEVVHCQPQLTCLAYRLEAGDQTVVFGGDTAPTPRLTELARGADVLLHMCHFINGAVTDPRLTGCCSGHLDAARTAREAGVGTLVLVHLTEQLETPGVRERVLFEVGEIFSGQVVLGEDLTRVPLQPAQIVQVR